MRRILLPIAAATLLIGAVQAQDEASYDGRYMGHGEGELTVVLEKLEGNVYAIDIQTIVPYENNIPGCSGGISGQMPMGESGGNFFVENEDYESGSNSPMLSERYCEIGLNFDENGFLILDERSGCLAYHGASCGFSGELMHEGAAG